MKRVFKYKKGEILDYDSYLITFIESLAEDITDNFYPIFKRDTKITIIVER